MARSFFPLHYRNHRPPSCAYFARDGQRVKRTLLGFFRDSLPVGVVLALDGGGLQGGVFGCWSFDSGRVSVMSLHRFELLQSK